MEILKRFKLLDCKPMAIPLVSNWRKIDASGSDGFDPTLYYLVSSIYRIAYVSGQHSTKHHLCNQLFESVHGGPLESALDGCEAHTSLHQRYSGVWIGL